MGGAEHRWEAQSTDWRRRGEGRHLRLHGEGTGDPRLNPDLRFKLPSEGREARHAGGQDWRASHRSVLVCSHRGKALYLFLSPPFFPPLFPSPFRAGPSTVAVWYL